MLHRRIEHCDQGRPPFPELPDLGRWSLSEGLDDGSSPRPRSRRHRVSDGCSTRARGMHASAD